MAYQEAGDTVPLLDPVYDGPLPEANVLFAIERAARQRSLKAARFVKKMDERIGGPGVRLGGFARRGAYYEYKSRKAFISRQVLALGSPQLVGFILAHEVGHATQAAAKRSALAWEQVGVSALAVWVALAVWAKLPFWADSPALFSATFVLFTSGLRAIDLWWEIDADKKARRLTGYNGTLKEIFAEFLSVETTCKPNWQARIRSLVFDTRQRISGL